MMKTWLMRRAVRRPVLLERDSAHQFIGMQAALHQQLAFGLMDEFHGPCR